MDQEDVNFENNDTFEHSDYIFVNDSSEDSYEGSSSEEEEEEEDIQKFLHILPDTTPATITQHKATNLCTFETTTLQLTPEEHDIISNCTDKKLKKILVLNRVRQLKLKDVYNELVRQINEHKTTLKVLETCQNVKEKTLKRRAISRNRYLKPYLQDKKGFRFPPNEDAIMKKANGEVNVNSFPRRKALPTSVVIELRSQVMLNYFKNKCSELEFNLKKSKVKKYGMMVKDHEKALKKWKDNFQNMKPPKLWDDAYINWNTISFHFSGKFTIPCLRAMWNMYGHPSINKSEFSPKELEELKDIALKHKCENWDLIAKELNSNRTAFQLCLAFQSINCNNFYHRFSPEEDKELLRVVNLFKVGNYIPWTKVMLQFKNRSKSQIYARYRHIIKNQKTVKYGAFSKDEDKLLLCLVEKYGEGNFDEIQEVMPHRTKEQLKSRFLEYLSKKTLTLGNWTIQEDKTILEFVNKRGRKWSLLTKIVKNRNASHLRHRYTVLKSYIDENPNIKLEDIPRRTHKYLQDHEFGKCKQELIKTYLANDNLPKINLHKEIIKGNMLGRPRRTALDDELIDFFRPTAHIKKSRMLKFVTEQKLENAATIIKAFLDLLGVSLNLSNLNSLDHPLIDDIDLEILHILSRKQKENDLKNTICDIPPNVNTIQILRGLLLYYQKYKVEKSENYGEELTFSYEDEDHYNVFQKRLKAIIKWPCVMSIVHPPDISNPVVEKLVPPPEPKKIGRPKKNMTKIDKMNEARLKKLEMKGSKPQGASSQPSSSTQDEEPVETIIPSEFEPRPSTSEKSILPNLDTNAQLPPSSFEVSKGLLPANTKILMKVDKAQVDKLKLNLGKKMVLLGPHVVVKRQSDQPSTTNQKRFRTS